MAALSSSDAAAPLMSQQEAMKLKYLEAHNVYKLVDEALTALLDEMPEDPHTALANYLARHARQMAAPTHEAQVVGGGRNDDITAIEGARSAPSKPHPPLR